MALKTLLTRKVCGVRRIVIVISTANPQKVAIHLHQMSFLPRTRYAQIGLTRPISSDQLGLVLNKLVHFVLRNGHAQIALD